MKLALTLLSSYLHWGSQGAHNGLCDSLGWQGGNFAFSASFLILNEIMPPGPTPAMCHRLKLAPPAPAKCSGFNC